MAGDTRVTGGGAFGHTKKIHRIGTLSIAGFCGHAFMGLLVIDWLRTKRNPGVLQKVIPADERDSVDVMELTPGGIILWNGWGIPLRLEEKHWAIGSGHRAALTAMNDGATAREAVLAALVNDEASGPPVQVEYLKPKRKR